MAVNLSMSQFSRTSVTVAYLRQLHTAVNGSLRNLRSATIIIRVPDYEHICELRVPDYEHICELRLVLQHCTSLEELQLYCVQDQDYKEVEAYADVELLKKIQFTGFGRLIRLSLEGKLLTCAFATSIRNFRNLESLTLKNWINKQMLELLSISLLTISKLRLKELHVEECPSDTEHRSLFRQVRDTCFGRATGCEYFYFAWRLPNSSSKDAVDAALKLAVPSEERFHFIVQVDGKFYANGASYCT